MATVTASQLSSDAKAVHTGVNVTGSALSIAGTLAASSVILLSKVPNGATLVDWIMRFESASASTQTLEFGTSASPSGIMTITTLSQTFSHSGSQVEPVGYGVFNQGWIRSPGGTAGLQTNDLMPVRISLSDDVQPSSVWIQARTGQDICNSAFFVWTLFYTMDGMRGHTTIR